MSFERCLLMEFADTPLAGLEMYVPLRYLGISIELIAYLGEEHSFKTLQARLNG